MTAERLRERPLHRRDFVLAPDEPGQPAPRRELKMRPQLSDPGHLVHRERLADSLDLDLAELAEGEVALAHSPQALAHRDRSGTGNRLQARRQVGREPDRRVLGVAAGLDSAYHDLAAAHPDPRLDRWAALRREPGCVLADRPLHRQCGVQRALRMVLVSERRAEQRENAVASGLGDVARRSDAPLPS